MTSTHGKTCASATSPTTYPKWSGLGLKPHHHVERMASNRLTDWDKIFLIFSKLQTGMGPIQPPTQWVSRAVSPAVKWPRNVANHSASSSVYIKNKWSYTSTPPYAFMSCTTVCPPPQHSDRFRTDDHAHTNHICCYRIHLGFL